MYASCTRVLRNPAQHRSGCWIQHHSGKSGKVAKAGAAAEQTADNIVLMFPYRNRRQCGLGQAALPYGDLSAKFVIAEYRHQGVRVQRETAAETPALNREKDFRANVLNHGKLSETVSSSEILKAN